MSFITLFFPPDLVWGTVSAAEGVEGIGVHSDWAADHEDERSGPGWLDLSRALADFDLAAEMGVTGHRLSLAWSRLEPEPGRFDPEVRDYYRAILAGLKARGIEPLVTLHHFANPRWFVEQGDFQGSQPEQALQRYTSYVVASFGDIVSRWVTFNEPMSYFFRRHITAEFPVPSGRRGWRPGLRGVRGMLKSHAAMYHKIKEVYPDAEVGVAKRWLVFDPERPDHWGDRWWAGRLSHGFNRAWLDAVASGRPALLLGGGRIRHLAGTFDFVGLNYDTRRRVKLLSTAWGGPAPGRLVSDDGLEMVPEGLLQGIRAVVDYQKPIIITGNGLSDPRDRLRPAYLATHLQQVWRAINFNFLVMGYYHDALIDGWMWHHGRAQRLGLIAVDSDSHERRVRPSGRFYGEVAHSHTLTSEMIERYAPSVRDVVFPT